MYTEEDLDSAVAAGVLSAEAVASLRDYLDKQRRSTPADEEDIRLVNSFNDVFVVVASGLLLSAVAYIGASQKPWLGGLAVAGAAWGLAEFFTRRRAMALPSIVLLLAFIGGVFVAVFLLLASGIRAPFDGLPVASGAAAAAVGAWLHWRRFRVPITVAAGAGAAVVLAITMLVTAWPRTDEWRSALMLVAGVIVFCVAMAWDTTDRARRTRRSDIAFWLHLLSAPLIVHPVFTMLDVRSGALGPALSVLVLYVAIAAVALVVDRRALMVSALIYVLFAFSALLQQSFAGGLNFALAALLIGSMLLLLSAFWAPSRSFLLRRLSPSIRRRVPPLR